MLWQYIYKENIFMAKDTNSQNQRVTIHQPPQRFFCETIIRIHLSLRLPELLCIFPIKPEPTREPPAPGY